jgi:hypothetical protein
MHLCFYCDREYGRSLLGRKPFGEASFSPFLSNDETGFDGLTKANFVREDRPEELAATGQTRPRLPDGGSCPHGLWIENVQMRRHSRLRA